MIEKLRYIFNRKDKIKLVGILILLVIGSLIELLGVSVFLPFVQILIDPDSISTNEMLNFVYTKLGFTNIRSFLASIALLIIFVYLFKNIYLMLEQNAILKFSYQTRMNLATRLLSTYMSEPYSFHLNKNIADLTGSIQYDANQFMLLVNASLQLVAEFAVILCLGVYLFHTSHSITLVIMGLLGLCFALFFLISKRVSQRIGKQNEEYNARLYQWINQSLGGIKEVKVLNREGFFVNSYKDVYKKLIKGAKNNELLAAVPKYIIETICMVGMLLAVIIKMYWGQNNIEVFALQLSAFAVAAFRLMPSAGKVSAYINNVMYGKPSLDLIYNDLKSIEGCPVAEFDRVDDLKKMEIDDEITIKDLSFRYADSDTNVLSNVNLSIKKGQTVALIGSSGAGKTTLADIILGLHTPTEGQILVDGKTIADDMDAYHHMLGYIPQSIYLSDDTIKNNIAFGIPEDMIDDNAVSEAMKKSQIYDFVQTLDKKENTFAGDRGVRLSGGQRQRIGIARALYYDPEVLVLDEATSALDNETETAVMEAIESLHGQKTMVIIAHRLSTIKNADVIYEIVDGKAVKRNKEEVIS